MLLQKLVEYSTHLPEIAPPGYSQTAVRYLIELDRTGRLRNPTPIDLSDAKNKRGANRIVPNVTKTSGIKPMLLAANAEYTLNLPRTPENAKRTEQAHAAYIALLNECVQQTGDESVTAVLTFLEQQPLAQLTLPEDYDRTGVIIFRVDNIFPTQQLAVQQFWAAYNAPQGELRQCLICGQARITLQTLKGTIKGIPDGQTAGTALISSNKEAFWSYGLTQSQTAPVCEDCADRFTKSLNHLLSDRSTRLILNNLAFTFWTREDVGFDLFNMLDTPSPAQVAALLNAARSGKRQPNIDDVAFYAVSLSASGARAVVRDWLDTTVGHVKLALKDWFAWQQIIDAWGEPTAPLGIYRLAAATVREMKDLPAQTPQALLRTALTGAPLPTSLLQQALRRNAADHDVTYPRAALIKLVLASQTKFSEDEMTQLQLDRPEPAYHCGRLLAVLEQIQKAALGHDVNSTIVDRFYGAASTAPASVFGPLLSRAQPHLSKLRRGPRENVGAALQLRLEEVLTRLPSFPRTLKLQDQALFALGYYHQRAYDRAQARAQAAQKKANSSTVPSNSDQGAAK